MLPKLQMVHGNHSLFGDGHARHPGHKIGETSNQFESLLLIKGKNVWLYFEKIYVRLNENGQVYT